MEVIINPQINLALINGFTLVCVSTWLLTASWRSSRVQAAIVLFCAAVQIMTLFIAIAEGARGLTIFSVLLLIGYAALTYRGAKAIYKGKDLGYHG